MIFLQAHLSPEKCWPSFRPNPRYLVTGFFVDPPSFLLLRFLHRSLVDPPLFFFPLRFLHRSLVDPPKVFFLYGFFTGVSLIPPKFILICTLLGLQFFLWWSKRSVSMISKAFQSTPSCRKYFLYHPIWFSIIDCIESFGSHPHKKKIPKSKVSSSKPLFFSIYNLVVDLLLSLCLALFKTQFSATISILFPRLSIFPRFTRTFDSPASTSFFFSMSWWTTFLILTATLTHPVLQPVLSFGPSSLAPIVYIKNFFFLFHNNSNPYFISFYLFSLFLSLFSLFISFLSFYLFSDESSTRKYPFFSLQP